MPDSLPPAPAKTPPFSRAGCALLCGALVGLPKLAPELACVQLAGLGGFFWLFRRARPGFWRGLGWGLAFGAGMAALRTPYTGFRWEAIAAIFALMLILSLPWFLATWLVRARGAVAAALAWAAALTLLDVAQIQAFGFFGTAQMFALSWAASPKAIAFASLWGWASIDLFVAGFAALAALLFEPEARNRARAALILWCLCFWLPGWAYRLTAETPQRLNAVAVGFWDMPLPGKMPARVKRWSDNADALPIRAGAEDSASPAAAKKALAAAPPGPVFFVFPEFAFAEKTNAASRQWLDALTKTLPPDAMAAAPWFDNEGRFNQCSLLDSSGERARYRKTHLLRYIENHACSPGDIATVSLEGITLGVMICQDDNFTDVARGLSRAGAQVVAIPVMDWPGVNTVHPLSAVLRAIEGRFAVVRAAACGETAIISATGETLARATPAAVQSAGEVVLQSSLNAGAAHSLYARWGDKPLLVFCALAVLQILIPRRRA